MKWMETIEDMVKLLKWIEATHFHGGTGPASPCGIHTGASPAAWKMWMYQTLSWKIPELNFIAGKIIFLYMYTYTFL
jgi:hypothetical protein